MKIKYKWRIAKMTPKFYGVILKAKILEKFCMWMSEVQPGLTMYLCGESLSDATARCRAWETAAESWRRWKKKQLFLGADKDNPDGVYARKPSDMIMMTSDEYEEWSREEP